MSDDAVDKEKQAQQAVDGPEQGSGPRSMLRQLLAPSGPLLRGNETHRHSNRQLRSKSLVLVLAGHSNSFWRAQFAGGGAGILAGGGAGLPAEGDAEFPFPLFKMLRK